jgi:acylphosphatase
MMVRRFRVEGRVQGVAFRAHTRARALELHIVGHAKNLPDGSVEVLAVGSEVALAALESFLWRGPLHARVNQVSVVDVELTTTPTGFAIL